jgi:hypothetical protein
MGTPTIDGTAHGISTNANATLSLTTTQNDDIIVVMAYNEFQNSGAGAAVSSVTATGLTFAQRSISNSSTHGSLEIWWAHAASPLTAATITVAWAAAFDDSVILALGVNGCGNLSAPWDANGSLPTKASFSGGVTNPGVTGVSTTTANDFLIAAIGSVDISATHPIVPSAWTDGPITGNGGGVEGCTAQCAFLGVSTTQSSIAPAFQGSMVGPWNAGEMIVDALIGSAPTPPSGGGFFHSTFSMLNPRLLVAAAGLELARRNPLLTRRGLIHPFKGGNVRRGRV